MNGCFRAIFEIEMGMELCREATKWDTKWFASKEWSKVVCVDGCKVLILFLHFAARKTHTKRWKRTAI